MSSASVPERARLYACGEMRRLERDLVRFRDDLRAVEVSMMRAPGKMEEMQRVVVEITRWFSGKVEDAIASGFVIGHGTGLVDREERPRWRR